MYSEKDLKRFVKQYGSNRITVLKGFNLDPIMNFFRTIIDYFQNQFLKQFKDTFLIFLWHSESNV